MKAPVFDFFFLKRKHVSLPCPRVRKNIKILNTSFDVSNTNFRVSVSNTCPKHDTQVQGRVRASEVTSKKTVNVYCFCHLFGGVTKSHYSSVHTPHHILSNGLGQWLKQSLEIQGYKIIMLFMVYIICEKNYRFIFSYMYFVFILFNLVYLIKAIFHYKYYSSLKKSHNSHT